MTAVSVKRWQLDADVRHVSEFNHVWLFVLDDCASFLQGEPYYGAFSSTVNATEVKMCENLLAFI